MTLSIIIVNYNVKLLLEQCLISILQAVGTIDTEIFVIDNASTDSSIEYLQPRFPLVKFIGNKVNTGFAKANNQALTFCTGKYILFLNPDTVLPPESLQKCIDFMDAHNSAGALGVRMINGENDFLKESKRGFPSPAVSFWKLSGIIKLLPRSKYFGKYYLGHLPENITSEVEVLSGAFMMVKSSVLKITGGFDERFFMYAEDIDLSFRIMKAGFKNYYFPEVTIIHYKGSSTKKDSRYVKQFYLAMSQFVKKHYGTGIFSGFLDTGIRVRALIEILRQKFSSRK